MSAYTPGWHTGWMPAEGKEVMKYCTHHRNSYGLPFSRQGTASCGVFGEVRKHPLGGRKDKILKLYFEKNQIIAF